MRLSLQKHLILPLTPPEWSLQVDTRHFATAATLLTLQNEQGIVISVEQTEGLLKAEIHFDAKATPIILLAELPDSNAVSLLISNSKSRVALYLNGQLCDEDWTLSSVPLENCVCSECVAEVILSDDVSIQQQYRLNSSAAPVTDIQNW